MKTTLGLEIERLKKKEEAMKSIACSEIENNLNGDDHEPMIEQL